MSDKLKFQKHSFKRPVNWLVSFLLSLPSMYWNWIQGLLQTYLPLSYTINLFSFFAAVFIFLQECGSENIKYGRCFYSPAFHMDMPDCLACFLPIGRNDNTAKEKVNTFRYYMMFSLCMLHSWFSPCKLPGMAPRDHTWQVFWLTDSIYKEWA